MDNLGNMDAIDVMRGGGATDIIQRPAIDKQLVETVGQYAKPEHVVLYARQSTVATQKRGMADN